MNEDIDPITTLVTGTQAANHADVALTTLCNWRDRGYLVQDGYDAKGRPRFVRKYLEVADRDYRGRALYRMADVARAEQATRKNSGRRIAA